MEKINIAELLKDCPKGMELDCTVFENLTFEEIDEVNSRILCNIQGNNDKLCISFNKFGCYSELNQAKCVIFPKGKTTWEGFVSPCQFKDGDVVVAEDSESFQLFLLKTYLNKNGNSYSGYCYFGWNFDEYNGLFEKGNWGFNRLATEEEKNELFKVIKDNGYYWNDKTKTLEKLPIFKVGDRIKLKNSKFTYTITDLLEDRYRATVDSRDLYEITFERQDAYNLVPDKFDITTLKPFESKVLVRDTEEEKWKPAIWGYYDVDHIKGYPYETVGGNCFQLCIPYEGNKHLLGTTNDCDDFYKIWEK